MGQGRGQVNRDCAKAGSATPLGAIASTLNRVPIWRRSGQPLDFALQPFARRLVGAGAEPAGTLEQPHAEQEIALVDQLRAPGRARRAACRKRGKIDMRGEVGLAGIGQHIVVAMLLHRLQRVADRRLEHSHSR